MNKGKVSLPRRRGLYTRKTLLLLTAPFIWIIHESVWQTRLVDVDWTVRRRRATNPPAAFQRDSSNNNNNIIGIEDLADIVPIRHMYRNHTLDKASWRQAIVGREKVVDVLTRAGLQIDLEVLKLLPTWDIVKDLYGEEPVILGMERCEAFRKAHKPPARFVGIAGHHNCGTNAMVRYLKQNLVIPGSEREGFLPQVPWHKHGWASLRNLYNFSFPADHSSVMPVVVARDPYFWMHSMCESPYLMKWEYTEENCPHLLKKDGKPNPAKTQWGTYSREWDSLADVWSEFYLEYEEVDYPRLIIRFEGE